MNIKTIGELVGNTPLVTLEKIIPNVKLNCKFEFFNPTFSVKDRAAYYMIEKAIEKGELKSGGIVIEATSGNTGLGLALASKIFDYTLICVLFDDVPEEKIKLLKAYGVITIMCDSDLQSDEVGGYVWVSREISKLIPGAFLVNQFENLENVNCHYSTTGPEIEEATGSSIDYFFSTIGTGGTITGVGKYLKECNPHIRVIGVEPVGGIYQSALNGEIENYVDHRISSISDNFISPNLDFDIIDEIIKVEDDDSFNMCTKLLVKEGIFVGTSSGCVVAGIEKYLQFNPGISKKNIVTILPDMGYKYQKEIITNNKLFSLSTDKENSNVSINSYILDIVKSCNLKVL